MPGVQVRNGDVGELDASPVTGPGDRPATVPRFGVPICLGTLLLLARVPPALAGIGERNIEIGAEYGLIRFDPDLLGETGDRWSLRAGRHETDQLQWEGQVIRGRVEETPLPGAQRRVTSTLALVNLVLNFHPRRDVVPYVLLGVGLAKTKLEAVGLSTSDTQAGYQIGGGSRFFFGSRSAAALRVEIAILGNDAFEQSYFHTAIAAGLTFWIGRDPAPGTGGHPAAVF